jgi:predicted RNA-binding Zn ribbon-like protein
MPEHRDGTPAVFRELESFLWHDFDDGLAAWLAWLRRRNLGPAGAAASASFPDAMRLHTALRTLQAANTDPQGGGCDEVTAHQALNRLIGRLKVRPFVETGGGVRLTSPDASDPVGPLLIEALETMCLGLWQRFKLCREPTCRASFYDTSKASRKIWCEMLTCGSQNKMRRYRARS